MHTSNPSIFGLTLRDAGAATATLQVGGQNVIPRIAFATTTMSRSGKTCFAYVAKVTELRGVPMALQPNLAMLSRRMIATRTQHEPAFVAVGLLAEVSTKPARAVTIGDNIVALFAVKSDLFALDDWCLRCGTSLASGSLHGSHVVCPGCDWRYHLPSGSVEGVPGLYIDTFEVRVADSLVHVCVVPKAFPLDSIS